MTPPTQPEAGTVAGILLAAGSGSRFGTPKALIVLDGQLLVERGVALLTAGGCQPVHVVLGAAADDIETAADLTGATTVRNPRWLRGMGSSLRLGLASLPANATAVVIALVDQPFVGVEAVRRLLRAHARGAAIAVAGYHGRPGNPVLLARSTWPAVAEAARGDVGARAYLRQRPEQVTVVPCEDTGTAADVDTPEDLALLLRQWGNPTGPSGTQQLQRPHTKGSDGRA